MPNLYRFLAVSDHWAARAVRSTYRSIDSFSVPAPRLVTRPARAAVMLLQAVWHQFLRIFICEPLFKAACTKYGRHVHTGPCLHWIQGKGELIVGDHVTLGGKSNIFFAARYTEKPRLEIGDDTGIGNHCAFVVGKQITIGRHCRIAANIAIFDTPGHPSDPAARLANLPLSADEVRPITIADNVWIGTSSIIFPGVTIGEGSVVAMGSVVMGNVAPNTLVAGNPARLVRSLSKEERSSSEWKETLTRTHGR